MAAERFPVKIRHRAACLLLLGALWPTAPALGQIRRPDRTAVTHSGSVRGQVIDETRRPVPLVLVMAILVGPDTEFGTVSNAEGAFRLEGLPAGQYRLTGLTMDGSGLESKPQTFRLGPTEVAEVKILLLLSDEGTASIRPLRRRPHQGPRLAEIPEFFPPTPSLRPRPPETPERASGGKVPGLEPEFAPLGHAGRRPQFASATPDFVPTLDRWRIGFPTWDRYARSRRNDSLYVLGRPADPYNLNVLKGDYAILGDRWFLSLEGISDTLSEFRRLPVVGPPSSERPTEPEFFSRGDQFQFVQQFEVSADLFRGYSQFKPFDLRFRVTPALNLNYVNVEELGLVNIDVRRGTTRGDSHASLEEAFVEVRLAETSPNFDFLSVRAGTQFFNSDFRGFVFLDNQPGIRLFGTARSNSHQYNVAYFYMAEKDTNSLLNTFDWRRQHVVVANYYIQDFVKKGYTTQFSVHFNNDRPSVHFNTNDFVVRPAPIGNVEPKSVNAVYLGWAGDGHLGVLNINHAFYQVLGQEQPNQLAGDVFGAVNSDINAQMFALEVSVDRDWRRYKGSFYFASGDDDLRDNRSRGFDGIVDAPFFAGGGTSLWNRQEIRLTGTAVALNQRLSLNPNLRSSKDEGQSNFVNPGIMIFNGGVDAELTPKIKASANLNVLSFIHTEVFEALLFQSGIGRFIGTEASLGAQYRPWLNNNIIVTGGAAVLLPGRGFRDIYTSKSLLSTFVEARLTF